MVHVRSVAFLLSVTNELDVIVVHCMACMQLFHYLYTTNISFCLRDKNISVKVANFWSHRITSESINCIASDSNWDALPNSISIWLSIFSTISILVYGFCLDLILFLETLCSHHECGSHMWNAEKWFLSKSLIYFMHDFLSFLFLSLFFSISTYNL